MRKRLREAAHQSIRFRVVFLRQESCVAPQPHDLQGSPPGPLGPFGTAPPSNGIGLIRSFCARWIAAFTTIFALFKNLGWEEKYCLSWQSSSSGSAHAPAYQ